MNWLKQLVLRRRESGHLSDEIAEHLQEKVEELVASGLSREEATFAARREFGNLTLLQERSREVWQWTTLESTLRDLKYALRQLRRNPGFTLTVLFTLALAIGANTAVFTMVNALFLRPLPYPRPHQLASLTRNYNYGGNSGQETEDGQNGEVWELVRDNVTAAQFAVFSYGASGVNLQTKTAVRYVRQQRVSAGYFEILGIAPLFGRSFTSEEDRPNGPKAVILSFGLWHSLFSEDRAVLGRAILLKGEPHVIVAVLPENIHSIVPADLWTPLQPDRHGEGGGENYNIILRLRDGASWAQLYSQLSLLRPDSFLPFLKEDPARHAWLSALPLQQELSDAARKPTLILMSAVAFILLIACANLAGLMLVRVTRRSGELATRLALGATHASLLRQLMMEPLILAFSGGATGVALAVAGLGLFAKLLPPDMVPVGGLGLDGRVLIFALAASTFTTLLTGVLPALESRRVELRPSMAATSRAVHNFGHRRMRQALIAGEIALTVVLLASAGLLIRTLIHLQTLPPGFDATNVMTAQVSLDDARYHDSVAFRKLLRQSLDAMKRIPGVDSAAVALSLPFERGLNNGFQLVEGAGTKEGHMSSAAYVTPDFFNALQIPVLAGRVFNDGDTEESATVAVVNASFAKEFFHSTEVVGRHFRSGKTVYTIVGVVGDVTKRPGLFRRAPLSTEVTYYFPATQFSGPAVAMIHVWFQPSWIVRTHGPISGLTEAMQKAMAEADPALPFAGFHRLGDFQIAALRQQRFEVLLLGVLAGLALLLSLVGVYGLVSNMVLQRTREIGIRMALGSTVRQAMIEIGTSGIIAVGFGIVGGLGLAAFSLRIIRSELFGVKTYDPLTMIAVPLLMVLAAAVAVFAPTQRIARIDPALTLRAE